MSTPLYYGKWYEPQGVWAKLLDEDIEEIRDMVAEVVHKELASLRREEGEVTTYQRLSKEDIDALGAQFFDILSDTLKRTAG